MDQAFTPGQKILAALTEEEFVSFLDALLDTDSETLRPTLQQLDGETARTVEHILSPQRGDSEEAVQAMPVSRERLREIREGLWRKWRETVAQLGDEEGKYAVREAPREPPYFDAVGFLEDLEEIAEQMLPYLDRAFEAFQEQELFSGAFSTSRNPWACIRNGWGWNTMSRLSSADVPPTAFSVRSGWSRDPNGTGARHFWTP